MAICHKSTSFRCWIASFHENTNHNGTFADDINIIFDIFNDEFNGGCIGLYGDNGWTGLICGGCDFRGANDVYSGCNLF